jgi:hypothetical protein
MCVCVSLCCVLSSRGRSLATGRTLSKKLYLMSKMVRKAAEISPERQRLIVGYYSTYGVVVIYCIFGTVSRFEEILTNLFELCVKCYTGLVPPEIKFAQRFYS